MYAAPPKINLVVLRSTDIDRAARFYQAMGLLFSKHRHGVGPEHYTSSSDALVFEIYPLGKHAPSTATRIGFSVDDVDGVVSMLIAIGAEVVCAPVDHERGRHAIVKDLDGHVVELLTPSNRERG